MAIGSATLLAAPTVSSAAEIATPGKVVTSRDLASPPTVTPRGNALPITGTFLDEISHDIPHQNS